MRYEIRSSGMVVMGLMVGLSLLLGCASAHAAGLQAATATPQAVATGTASTTPTATGTIEATATVTATNGSPLPAEILNIVNDPKYKHSFWGLEVTDVKTGETLYELNPDKLLPPGSTAKLFSTAAALDALGADYRFTTPIYANGVISPEGTLNGDLILVASGDLTMGGRTTPDGKIAFTNADHGDANALPSVDLTTEDPLAGLNDLAKQVADAGIKQINGDVIIDHRLFETLKVNDGVVSPMVINENLIDVVVTPTQISETAKIDWRPQTAMYQIQNNVRTVAAGEPTTVKVSSPRAGQLVVTGQIAADAKNAIRVYSVPNPAVFGRTLLIEALKRAGVSVTAAAVGDNPTDKLPKDFSDAKEVAHIVSPPFSENIKLTNKVSQNYDANMMPILVAMKNGKKTYAEGMALMAEFFKKAGVDTDGVALEDGEGGAPLDYISVHAETQLLDYMAKQPDFQAYKDSQPILGVDGSLATAASPNSPAIGHVFAKTGTRAGYDPLNNRVILQTKALAGYITTAKGRELSFAVLMGPTPVPDVPTAIAVGNDLGLIAEILYKEN